MTQLTGGKHQGTLASVSSRYLLTTSFQITTDFLCLQTITSNNGQLFALLQRPLPMGGVDPDAMGISWYLSLLITIPGERCDSLRALSPLPHRSMGRCREAPMWYGISLDSAWQNHWGGDGIWADCSMGTSTPSMPPLLGWGGEEAPLLIKIGYNWAYAFM